MSKMYEDFVLSDDNLHVIYDIFLDIVAEGIFDDTPFIISKASCDIGLTLPFSHRSKVKKIFNEGRFALRSPIKANTILAKALATKALKKGDITFDRITLPHTKMTDKQFPSNGLGLVDAIYHQREGRNYYWQVWFAVRFLLELEYMNNSTLSGLYNNYPLLIRSFIADLDYGIAKYANDVKFIHHPRIKELGKWLLISGAGLTILADNSIFKSGASVFKHQIDTERNTMLMGMKLREILSYIYSTEGVGRGCYFDVLRTWNKSNKIGALPSIDFKHNVGGYMDEGT